jgi:hypothetical protein
MHGPNILAATMTLPQERGGSKSPWQYHSRSDRHSKVACWGVLFDLLRTSALLRKHAQLGKIVFGINFEMNNYASDLKKDLDLVIARPAGESETSGRGITVVDLAEQWKVELTPLQRSELERLPTIHKGALAGSGVQIALEAKATMTAHQKAQPRLYDELSSSHAIVHGASSHALAVGLVLVNTADTFISPGMQRGPEPVVSTHKQPAAAEGTIAKVKKIRRRTKPDESGFDGLGIVALEVKNDGTPVRVETTPPAPQPGSIFFYDDMLTRIANEYDARFSSI